MAPRARRTLFTSFGHASDQGRHPARRRPVPHVQGSHGDLQDHRTEGRRGAEAGQAHDGGDGRDRADRRRGHGVRHRLGAHGGRPDTETGHHHRDDDRDPRDDVLRRQARRLHRQAPLDQGARARVPGARRRPADSGRLRPGGRPQLRLLRDPVLARRRGAQLPPAGQSREGEARDGADRGSSTCPDQGWRTVDLVRLVVLAAIWASPISQARDSHACTSPACPSTWRSGHFRPADQVGGRDRERRVSGGLRSCARSDRLHRRQPPGLAQHQTESQDHRAAGRGHDRDRARRRRRDGVRADSRHSRRGATRPPRSWPAR